MQFDHVRGEKKLSISTMTMQSFSEKMVREELAKCEVVCANCHAGRTYSRLRAAGGGKYYELKVEEYLTVLEIEALKI